MMLKRFLMAMLSGLIALTFTGCAAVVVGGAAVGTYAYVKGALKSSEPVTLDQAWAAAQAGLKDLRYRITDQSRDKLQAKLEARSPGDVKVQVSLKKTGQTLTEIRIRVGTFGDEIESKRILEGIKQRF